MQIGSLFLSLALAGVANAALVVYTANITYGAINPDGRSRQAWLINGKSPGAPLIADQGDRISVKVHNNGIEPITIHFHGIEQIGTIWSDGVPGVTQYPIQVGHSFVYNWTADSPGAAWFHSHYKMQVDDGLRAPIFIRPTRPGGAYSAISKAASDQKAMKAAEVNPFQLFAYDYKKLSSDYYMQQWNTYRVDPLCIDDILINGKGQVICPSHAVLDPLVPPPIGRVTDKGCAYPNNTMLFPFAGGEPSGLDPDIFFNCQNTSTPLEVFIVKASQKYAAFNLLNAGSVWDLKVSIDKHKLIVFAADGGYVKPQTVDVINIPIGERYQFFVKLDQPLGDYAVRVASAAVPQMVSGYAVLRYANNIPSNPPVVRVVPAAKSPKLDYAGNTIGNGVDLNPALLSPYPANPPPAGLAAVTLKLDVERPTEYDWELNEQPWTSLSDTFKPILFQPSQVSQLASNVYSNITMGSIVDVILTVTAGNPALHPPHPIHKHGRKAYFLGAGTGPFPYASIAAAQAAGFPGINMVNPPYRDDFLTPLNINGTVWLAFRFRALDAAPLLMHCHIDPHLASGMAYMFAIGLDHLPAIPPYYSRFTG